MHVGNAELIESSLFDRIIFALGFYGMQFCFCKKVMFI